MKHVLVVDDELGSRESLKAIFHGKFEVSLAENTEQAMAVLSQKKVDLVLLDVIMPKQDGVSFLKELQGLYPGMPVIMVSASDALRPVVESMRIGAYDFVSKPFDVDEIQLIARRAMESTTLHRRVASLETDIAREFPVAAIVGSSEAFARALDSVQKAAETDATVLIQGESGTGKELVARLLHTLSSRHDEPFVAVHCGALPETLMESELFGHEKGAFTGADKMKPGRFDLAGSGTLFFDEVSEMSAATQVKLLRVLQEREFMRVGGTRLIRTNARIVAASAKDLRKEVVKSRFRDDLFYRISVVPVTLPPLRERTGDISLLARHFLGLYGGRPDLRVKGFSPEALDMMSRYPWPGNVRELRNVVERMLVLHGKEDLIRPEFLPEEFHRSEAASAPSPEGGTLEDMVNRHEREIIEKALRQSNGIQTRAAHLLGTTRRILRYRMEKLNIQALPQPPEAGAEP